MIITYDPRYLSLIIPLSILGSVQILNAVGDLFVSLFNPNCSLLIIRLTRGASLLDFPLLRLWLQVWWHLRVFHRSVFTCFRATYLDMGRLEWKRKKDTHSRLLNVSVLSKHLRAMVGPYLPFVCYRVSSLVHLTGGSVFQLQMVSV